MVGFRSARASELRPCANGAGPYSCRRRLAGTYQCGIMHGSLWQDTEAIRRALVHLMHRCCSDAQTCMPLQVGVAACEWASLSYTRQIV